MTKFPQRLKALRKSKRITQDQLAKELSVDRRSISNWEKGLREPSYDTLMQIIKFFEESADYMLGLSD